MLNDQALWDTAEKTAARLTTWTKQANSRQLPNAVTALLESGNRLSFIDALREMAPLLPQDERPFVKELGRQVDALPTENFRHFVGLLRFNYALV